MKRKKPVKLPKPCRFYLLADEESGQVDGSCFYTSALSARAAGETSELVALYSFMGYRGRGKQKAPLDESDETSGGSPCRCEKVGADTVSRHVDDFIDDPSSDPYAASAPPSLKPLIVWLVMGDRSYNADWSLHSVWSTAAGANRECDRLRAQDRHPRCQWKVVPAALDQISEDWICPNAS